MGYQGVASGVGEWNKIARELKKVRRGRSVRFTGD